MHRIAVFMGTRPEAIKMAPVIRALEGAEGLAPLVISSGQHREMLAQVVDLFDLRIDHDLQVMQPNQSLASLSARLITSIDAMLQTEKPKMALVQGDTTTVLMAALVCFYHRIPVGHVEAGLRTGNIWSPYPEEANRKLASSLVSLHFTPTEMSCENLLNEKVARDQIVVTGNTVIDALYIEIAKQQEASVQAQIDEQLGSLLGSGWQNIPYVLITGHRRENFGGGFDQICKALQQLAERFVDHRFIYPVHLNPNVQEPVYQQLKGYENIQLIPPQDYRYFVALMNHCQVVLTDSGGVQEEAPGLGKPVLVMRNTTERPEGVQAGTVQLIGTDANKIVEYVSRLLTDSSYYRKMAEAVNPYGDGKAAGRIIEALQKHLALCQD